jgi:putative transposase
MSRGMERRAIFLDARDRRHFLDLLGALRERFATSIHAYALMDNHYHLLLELSRPNLSRAMQWLKIPPIGLSRK